MNGTPGMDINLFKLSNDKQLIFHAPGEQELYENLNGVIYLMAPESLTHLRKIDPKRIGKAAVAKKILRNILQGREDTGEFGWTLCVLPTAEMAKQAGITMKQYAFQIRRACFLDMEAPVNEYTPQPDNDIRMRINSRMSVIRFIGYRSISYSLIFR